LLWVVGAVALAVGAVFAINFRDEPLDTDAAKVLERSEAMPPVPGNAYVYATGFFAPPNEDPYALGEKLLASYEAISRAGDAKVAQQTIDRPGRLAVELTKLPCDVANEDCIAHARQAREALRTALQGLGVVSERCTALHQLPAWHETYVPDHIVSPFAITGAVHVCQRLRSAHAALELQAGLGREALARVLSDIEFQRRALAGSVTLLGKMMTAAAVSRSVLFLSDLMRSEPRLAASNREAIANAVRPLTLQERTLAPMLRSEFRHMARTVREFDAGRLDLSGEGADDALKWLAKTPLHRANATINRAWPSYRDLIEAQGLPAHAFRDAERKWRESFVQRAVPGADWVYNPVGKVVLAIATPQLSEYVGRMHDVDALVRLVAAQARIAPGSDETAVRHVLDDSALANPYTGAPMDFEPKARTLSFATEGRPTWRGKRWGGEGRVILRLAASTPL
jgi:hypothetical protein